MRVWLLQASEPLPVDGVQVRLLRTGVLAETLLAAGHEVLWWSSAFDHANKRHRVPRSMKVPLGARGEVYLLAGCGYRKNVSLSRLWDHRQVARGFDRLAPEEKEPDLIVANLPTPNLCAAGARYAARRGIPCVVDLRDQWPDLFLDLVPRFLRGIGRLFLKPMFRQTSQACRLASGLVGVTPALLHWGLSYAKRPSGVWDRVFLLGYQPRVYPSQVLQEARGFWDGRGVRVQSELLTICFFGSLGRQFVLEPVIEAARCAEADGVPVRWILCGTGDAIDSLRNQAQGLSTVLFPGWVDGAQIQTLMERSHLGLAPYQRSANFWGHFPNKVGEYLSAGLPILSTLVGGLDKFLDQYRCGWTYDPTNSAQLFHFVKEIVQQRDQLATMSLQAKKLFLDYFDAQKIYPAYVEYLCEIAHQKSRQRQAA